MPRGDGTGPPSGGGPGQGRGKGRGRMNGGYAQGPGGTCVCPNCGETRPHIQGQPCYAQKCSKCGISMTRNI